MVKKTSHQLRNDLLNKNLITPHAKNLRTLSLAILSKRIGKLLSHALWVSLSKNFIQNFTVTMRSLAKMFFLKKKEKKRLIYNLGETQSKKN